MQIKTQNFICIIIPLLKPLANLPLKTINVFDNSIKQVSYLTVNDNAAVGTDGIGENILTGRTNGITFQSSNFNGNDSQLVVNPFDSNPRGIGTLSFWARQTLVIDSGFRDLFHLGELVSTTQSRVLRARNNGLRLISPSGLPATFGTGSPYTSESMEFIHNGYGWRHC